MDMDLSKCFTLDFVPFSKLLLNEYGIYFILVQLLYPANCTFTNSQKQCRFNVIRAVCISNHILEVFWTLYGSVVLRLLRGRHFPVCIAKLVFKLAKKKKLCDRDDLYIELTTLLRMINYCLKRRRRELPTSKHHRYISLTIKIPKHLKMHMTASFKVLLRCSEFN